ncbi:Flagellar assembly protein [gamma proteobacterium HdN1]|nr:Flagellar assembly protein [gamma proteobacterium HdN1]
MVDPHSRKAGRPRTQSVPPERLTAYERWVLPNMEDDDGVQEEFAIATAIQRKAKLQPPPQHSSHEEDTNDADPVAPEETITPLTAEDVEAIRQAAYEEGYQQGHQQGLERGIEEGTAAGYQQGHQQGYASGEDEVRSSALRLSQICRTLLEPIPANDQALEEVLKQLVSQICTQVVHRELLLDSNGISAVVKEALDCLNPGNKRIRIHLNPQDIEVIERELRTLNQWEGQWRLLAHNTITPGGCIIDTDDSIIDARAEKRLSALLQQVYSKDPSALDEDAGVRDSLAQMFDEVPAFRAPDTPEPAPAEPAPESEPLPDQSELPPDPSELPPEPSETVP